MPTGRQEARCIPAKLQILAAPQLLPGDRVYLCLCEYVYAPACLRDSAPKHSLSPSRIPAFIENQLSKCVCVCVCVCVLLAFLLY